MSSLYNFCGLQLLGWHPVMESNKALEAMYDEFRRMREVILGWCMYPVP